MEDQVTGKWIAGGLLTAAFLAANGAGAQAHPVSVQVLAINDLHGNLEPPKGNDGRVNGVAAGGTEYLATHLKNAEKENPNSIVVAAGDLFGASPLLSALSEEKPTIEAIEAMHISVTALGNHELDHGPDVLLERLKGAKIEYLAANVVREKNFMPATTIRTIGGVKIGFIGEILEDAPAVISGQSIKGMKFLEESKVANEAAAKLEKQGVHAIVLLVHVGGFQHPEKGVPVNENACVNFSGEIADLAAKLSPSIKVVISAHTHAQYNCQIAGHTVTSAGAYGRLFTKLNLSIDSTTDQILNVSATNVIVTRDVEKDPAQTAIIAKYLPMEEKIANRTVGAIAGRISKTENTSGESAMGDVIADSQLAASSSPQAGGAVIAVMNSGGIRAELAAGANGAKRDVSFGDLYAVQPFGNRITVHTMTGEMLRRLLEQQFSTSGGSNMLQVSDGFTYQYRLHAEPGHHVVPESVMLNGKPIRDTDSYRVEASDFLAAGSGALTAFREAKDGVIGPVDVDALVEYFKAHSPVAAGPQNRIVRLD
jgi:5'-nucleotidase